MTISERRIERAEFYRKRAARRAYLTVPADKVWAHWARVLSRIEAGTGLARTEFHKDGTVQTYDRNGVLRQERDAKGNITGYDSEGKVIFRFGVF